MKYCFFLFLSFFQLFSLYSQDNVVYGETREVVLSKMDSVLRFNVLEKSSKIVPDPNKYYYWFSQKQMRFNQGGYYGKLLHGGYFLFDADRKLIEKGNFKEGLKIGDWLRWHSNGRIALRESWRKGFLKELTSYNSSGVISSEEFYKQGLKNGRQRYYSESGSLVREVSYKRGVKHGKEICFSDQKPLVLKYKKGVQVNKSIKVKKPKVTKPKSALDNEVSKQGFFKRFFVNRKKNKEKRSIEKIVKPENKVVEE